MFGVFEFEYLKFKKDHVRSLIKLAMADGELHSSEEKFIREVAKKLGLREKQIDRIMEG